jgi:starch synthase (maltosyl-transferring)
MRANLTTELPNDAAAAADLSVPRRSLEDLAASRVAIEAVWPEIDGGRFASKRIAGDQMVVEADIFADGHDRIDAAVLYKRADAGVWEEAPMRPVDNDRWRGTFRLADNALYVFTIIAWRDLFASWRGEIAKKRAAGLAIDLELREGCLLVRRAADEATRGCEADRIALRSLADEIDQAERPERHRRFAQTLRQLVRPAFDITTPLSCGFHLALLG